METGFQEHGKSLLLGSRLGRQGLVQSPFSQYCLHVSKCYSITFHQFPAIFIGGAVLLGFTGVPLVALTLMLSTPVALAAYTMATSMGGNGKLSGELVVLTTALSCITMPLWLFLLKSNGLF